jgi:hypothetical protein
MRKFDEQFERVMESIDVPPSDKKTDKHRVIMESFAGEAGFVNVVDRLLRMVRTEMKTELEVRNWIAAKLDRGDIKESDLEDLDRFADRYPEAVGIIKDVMEMRAERKAEDERARDMSGFEGKVGKRRKADMVRKGLRKEGDEVGDWLARKDPRLRKKILDKARSLAGELKDPSKIPTKYVVAAIRSMMEEK